ncbi:sulfatase [Flavivirga rizhaonensis]|uniref:DUF4976 domain-containing protein n=1 Tax=Flavivirga rizhaonensis TaxID=2559571 RepID=A0A4S1E2Z5_9FLAO|nr:sulfatase [Flavivirga rizhaonensis]TGV04368.1 DUF4976 domain-containing protein [Flavivirga rizhaonensis]
MKQHFLLYSLFFILFNCSSLQKPNIILIVVDDLGWTDLSFTGSNLYQTPSVDKLAKEGTYFTNAYASCTVCSPTRASIMTGKYPATLHCTDWISGHKKPFAKMNIPNWTEFLDPNEITLPEHLKSAGYNTIHIGKWHLGEDQKYWPEHQGFDKNIGGWSVGMPQKGNNSNGYFSPYANPRLSDGIKDEYLTERLSDEAVKYIKNNKDSDSPFFINLWFYNVHVPLQAKQEKIDKYKNLVVQDGNHKNATYAAMIEHMDDAVGKITTILKELDIDKNTIIIFTSDNGGLVSERQITSNKPLREGKGGMYEGGVRVPFIIKWPHKIAKEKIIEMPIISNDILPTLLGLVKENKLIKNDTDGIDLSPLLLKDKLIKREALYWHYPHYHRQGAKPYSAIRKGDWKLIEIFEQDTLELYNLKDDISESKNLLHSHPDKAKELHKDLINWRKQVNAQLPNTNKNYNKAYENLWIPNKWKSKPEREFIEYILNSEKL